MKSNSQPGWLSKLVGVLTGRQARLRKRCRNLRDHLVSSAGPSPGHHNKPCQHYLGALSLARQAGTAALAGVVLEFDSSIPPHLGSGEPALPNTIGQLLVENASPNMLQAAWKPWPKVVGRRGVDKSFRRMT